MSSLISGIIDCVARPSTTDSPVRVIRKSASKDSPKCVSVNLNLTASDSESTVASTHATPPTSTYTRKVIPGEATAVFPVSTAEAVIMIPSDNDEEADDDDTTSSNSIDNAVKQQFEAAFATFLYKNPAFTSMSHANLSRLRAKLAKESAKNARAEAELRRQLIELRESKQRTELELQRELLVVTRAKAAREAELNHQIWTTRQATMSMDEETQQAMKVKKASTCHNNVSLHSSQGGDVDQYSPTSSPYLSYTPTGSFSPYASYDYGDLNQSPQPNLSWPSIPGSESFQEELQRSRVEHARLLIEMEKLRQQIAQSSID